MGLEERLASITEQLMAAQARVAVLEYTYGEEASTQLDRPPPTAHPTPSHDMAAARPNLGGSRGAEETVEV